MHAYACDYKDSIPALLLFAQDVMPQSLNNSASFMTAKVFEPERNHKIDLTGHMAFDRDKLTPFSTDKFTKQKFKFED